MTTDIDVTHVLEINLIDLLIEVSTAFSSICETCNLYKMPYCRMFSVCTHDFQFVFGVNDSVPRCMVVMRQEILHIVCTHKKVNYWLTSFHSASNCIQNDYLSTCSQCWSLEQSIYL